jgi:hypothetical protein
MLAPCAEPDEGGREAGGSARKKGIGAERRYKFVGYPKAFVSPADAGFTAVRPRSGRQIVAQGKERRRRDAALG